MGIFSWLFNKKNKDDKVKNTDAKSTEVKKIPDVEKKIAEEEKTVKTDEVKAADFAEVNNDTKPATKSEAQKSKTESNAKKATSDKAVVVEKKPEANIEDQKAAEDASESTGYTGKFEINKAKDGKYFFNLYASNKVGIATSQMYSTAQSALVGVKSVIANAPKAPIEDQTLKNWEALPYPKWELYLDNGNKYRFRLNAPNGSCVCHSQGYTTKNACKNGIDSIIRSSKNAEIEKTYLIKKDTE